MEACSYFLPKRYRSVFSRSSSNDNNVKQHIAVYSQRLNERYGQKKLTDDGRTITFGSRDDRSTFTFSSYHVASNGLMEKKRCRTFQTTDTCDYSLYCCVTEICFMFKLETVPGGGTAIRISCISFEDSGDTCLHEDVVSLEYRHTFNQYSCSLSSNERKVVVITGRDLDSYGSDMELADNYVDILSYSYTKSRPTIQHERRRNLTEAVKLYDIDRIFFSSCGTKLFLIFGKCFVVYSLSLNVFGSVLDLSEKEEWHMSRYCFYLYNAYVGNVLLLCQSDGFIYTLREKNLALEHLCERDIHLDQHRDFHPEVLATFLHVDCFDDILIYFTVEREPFIVDYRSGRLRGKFSTECNRYIMDVRTNWSGEEVFVFSDVEEDSVCPKKEQVHVEILFVGKTKSLKDIAKLKVLQTFSKKQLRRLAIPANLKKEIHVF